MNNKIINEVAKREIFRKQLSERFHALLEADYTVSPNASMTNRSYSSAKGSPSNANAYTAGPNASTTSQSYSTASPNKSASAAKPSDTQSVDDVLLNNDDAKGTEAKAEKTEKTEKNPKKPAVKTELTEELLLKRFKNLDATTKLNVIQNVNKLFLDSFLDGNYQDFAIQKNLKNEALCLSLLKYVYFDEKNSTDLEVLALKVYYNILLDYYLTTDKKLGLIGNITGDKRIDATLVKLIKQQLKIGYNDNENFEWLQGALPVVEREISASLSKNKKKIITLSKELQKKQAWEKSSLKEGVLSSIKITGALAVVKAFFKFNRATFQCIREAFTNFDNIDLLNDTSTTKGSKTSTLVSMGIADRFCDFFREIKTGEPPLDRMLQIISNKIYMEGSKSRNSIVSYISGVIDNKLDLLKNSNFKLTKWIGGLAGAAVK